MLSLQSHPPPLGAPQSSSAQGPLNPKSGPGCVEVWNALDEEVVSAKTLHNFKERLDDYRYGDGTIRA